MDAMAACSRRSAAFSFRLPILDIGWEEFMENQRRLVNNINRYEAGNSGVPRKRAALLQGIAVCGRCGRRMSLRYSGPAGDYPVYTCRADRDQEDRKCVRCLSMRTSKASCSRP
ncbi:zinc ribbon domain-containing protein [Mesorhizobium sp. M1227]|uniref:zinc ribbon domain-containing protein n=1 Tax=Mesorhizobium sp. M1227 TaxID=2957071 RepID=UPI00333D926B